MRRGVVQGADLFAIEALWQGDALPGRWVPTPDQRRSRDRPVGAPALFALLMLLARAWPGPLARDELAARAFDTRRPNVSHRARLRVQGERLLPTGRSAKNKTRTIGTGGMTLDATDKMALKAQISAVSAQNQAARGLASAPPPPAISGPPGMPVNLTPSLTPIAQALKMQCDTLDKVLKLLGDVIDKS